LPKKGPLRSKLAEALLLTVLFISVLLFVVYQLAVSKVEPEVPVLKEQVEFLSQELATLSKRYKRVRARQTVLERETEVIRKANRLLQQDESQRQAELNLDSPRVFQFILTLTQNIRRASIISGKLRLDVEGTLDHRPVTLYWSQLTDGAPAEPSFRFKYFQQLEGYLTLPEHFSPTRLLVTLDVNDQRKPVSRAFDWQNLLDASAN